jgi:hypothetical protein
MEFWIDPENDKGDKSKHYTREQAVEYEIAFAHPLRARHEQHPDCRCTYLHSEISYVLLLNIRPVFSSIKEAGG